MRLFANPFGSDFRCRDENLFGYMQLNKPHARHSHLPFPQPATRHLKFMCVSIYAMDPEYVYVCVCVRVAH